MLLDIGGLRMIVYADMLLLLNGLVNYLLLDGTARFAGRGRVLPRLLLGAGVGAVYAVLYFCCDRR